MPDPRKCYACPKELPEPPVVALLSLNEKVVTPGLEGMSMGWFLTHDVDAAFCSLACAGSREIVKEN